jgi:hypothetical protein
MEHVSAREMLQAFEQDDFAKECVAPPKGIKKSSFFEAINNRGLEQLFEVFDDLVKKSGTVSVFRPSIVRSRKRSRISRSCFRAAGWWLCRQ